MLATLVCALVANTPAAPLSIPFEQYKLKNGMEVVLSRDARLPVVSVNLWYHVGAVHEVPGKSGFAHLFEHMMFQGSKNVADDVHLRLLEQIGSTDLNGTTNFDRTNYFATVPSHHLETVLWLESDRMGFLLPAMTEEKLRTQKEVVKNERRQSTENAPYGLAEEALYQSLFPKPHPYFGVVIGSMEDLEAASLKDVSEFFTRYYAPSNATLAIVGDFDPATAKSLVDKYFGSLPSTPKPAGPNVPKVGLTKEVRVDHPEKVANLAKVTLAWHSPALFADGDATADMLSSALSVGKSSRLYKRLVFEKQIAQSVSAVQDSMGAGSIFMLEATARAGVTLDALQQELEAVLAEVVQTGITEDELRRARNKLETGTVSGLQRVGGRANRLQLYNHYLGDPGYLQKDLARYAAVTAQMVQEFAKNVLDPSRRLVLHAVPAAAPATPAAKETK